MNSIRNVVLNVSANILLLQFSRTMDPFYRYWSFSINQSIRSKNLMEVFFLNSMCVLIPEYHTY